MNPVSKLPDYRLVFIAYVLLAALLTFRYWALGDVIAPHRQAIELDRPAISDSALENRKFSDYSNGYIPELTQLMHGRRSGWLTEWSDANELGRPLGHLSAFSPAYPPAALLGRLVPDPHRFITILSLSTCLIGGVFVLLLCRQLSLAPIAGLIAGTSMATSPLFMYWLTFQMFPAVATWAAGALYAMTRLSRRRDLAGWAILSFSVYSLLLTGYPQSVVIHAYFLSAFGLALATRQWQETGRKAAMHYFGWLAAACLVAIVLCIPAHLDVYRTALDSTRITADPAFFTEYLPRIQNLSDLGRFLTLASYPEILGRPIAPDFPFAYDGLSITPPTIFFAICALLLAFRQTWGWWIAIVLAVTFTVSPTAFLFGVKYLGFNLSPSIPLGNALLPIALVVAYGVHALYGIAQPARNWKLAPALGAIVVLAGLGGSIVFAQHHGVAVAWPTVALALIAILLLTLQMARRSPWLPCTAVLVTVGYSAYPLMLHQDPANIAMTSPLEKAVREHLPADARYAVLSPGLRALPPNFNASLGLNSIHSYNSLSSYRYRDLLKELGSDNRAFGRWNDSIQPDFHSRAFWMSNIAVILSPTELAPISVLRYVGHIGTAYMYEVTSRMGCCVQVPIDAGTNAQGDFDFALATLKASAAAKKTADLGDVKEFAVAGRTRSALVVSQKFHRDWKAQVLTASGWRAAPTVAINGVFQGVVLPADATQVRLSFLPYAQFAWIAHAFWLFALIALAAEAVKRRTRDGEPLKPENTSL